MIPVDHGQGSGVGGLVAYVLHDSGHAKTSERVEWFEGLNLPPVEADSVKTWARAMRQTVADADSLKASIGTSTRGRKLRKAYKHVSFSWDRDENPTKDEMVRAATEALKVMGFQDHEVILVAHNDKAQKDMHAIINRVHPRTGKVGKGVRAIRLQKWAEKHERQHGGIRVANRRKRRIIRELNALRRHNAAKRGKPPPEPVPLPPIEKKRARDPDGTPRVRNAADTRFWAQLYAAHSASDVPKAERKRDRIEVNHVLRQLQPAAAPVVPSPPVVVVVPERPRVPLPRARFVSPPAEQVPPSPVDVPVRPGVEFPVVQPTPAPVASTPPPVVVAVPERPRVPLPRARSVSPPAEQVPPPVDVPVRPGVEFPVVQPTPTLVASTPPPVAVPERPRVPIPDMGSRPSSDTWRTAAQLLAWLLEHLRRIWNRAGGDEQPGGGQPGDVSPETKRRTKALLRRHGVSEESIRENRDNLVGGELGESAGVGAERPAHPRLPSAPARDPTRSR